MSRPIVARTNPRKARRFARKLLEVRQIIKVRWDGYMAAWFASTDRETQFPGNTQYKVLAFDDVFSFEMFHLQRYLGREGAGSPQQDFVVEHAASRNGFLQLKQTSRTMSQQDVFGVNGYYIFMEGVKEVVDDLRGVEDICRMDKIDGIEKDLEVIATETA